ncbi:hypothetical protein [Frigidibacter mobilis]|uniref:DUF4148 domain-containing protein n=1 Tax=Frigidibacter mobilis TaxID=1335048 RepID=A0A159YYZ3_9RHOB|nr:hypothetical protein [Frigidibacter mobilis]AMY67671.1 hypothetical protein AKL17_0409 [Frigidibacter mobilis]
MKNLILAAAALVAVAGSASASGQGYNPNKLSNVDAAELTFYVRNVDVDSLTVAQVQSVQSALYGDEKGKVAALRAAVR